MRLPLFPLRTVLFPGGVLPLRVFETRYMDMARDCLKTGSPFGVCAILDEQSEVGPGAQPALVGCLAHIRQWDMKQLGVLNLRAVGGEKLRLLTTQAQADGLLVGEVELVAPEAEHELGARHASCRRVLEGLLAAVPEAASPDELGPAIEPPRRLRSAVWAGHRLAEWLPLPIPEKQALLELEDPLARLDRLEALLERAAGAN
ncbi:MAG TPA: LON peptidase substrate-binding domain-containing protein [Burkholderiaceae bacterium]|nr:LON peptidase substrate-binding domain-containing protein [Burkholderiaceae bacterium]HRZ00290.1 LON peptidase substrate-binding domain-containing protein [Burkholderiaceae bacterium]